MKKINKILCNSIAQMNLLRMSLLGALPGSLDELGSITFAVFCIPKVVWRFCLSKVRWLGTLQKAQRVNKFLDLLWAVQTRTVCSAKPCPI
jgi:hypothetical protein